MLFYVCIRASLHICKSSSAVCVSLDVITASGHGSNRSLTLGLKDPPLHPLGLFNDGVLPVGGLDAARGWL